MKNFFRSIFGGARNSDSSPKSAIIHEAMFSNAYDLSNNYEELSIRIHPEKRKPYDAFLTSDPKVESNGQSLSIKGIFLMVPGKNGPVEIPYEKVAQVKNNSIISTIEVTGFDRNGEPIIYEMKDGTIRIVFFQLPPESRNQHKKFNLDRFSEEFVNEIGCGMWHDDREIFHIPEPKENTISNATQFLKNYRKEKD